MCVSAATLNAQSARKLEWSQESDSEGEDELCLQAASFGMRSQECYRGQSEEASTSAPMPLLSQHRQKGFHNSTELGYQLKQLQQVHPCRTQQATLTFETAKSASNFLVHRHKRRGGWLNCKPVYSKFISESYVICMISGKT